jgi:outer membrane lipoprotein-sorting protein
LDKEFIIEKIDLMKQEININSSYKFQLDYENLEIAIFFDEKNLNLRGWTTMDIYQNKVETNLSSVETNILVDEKIFDIRNYTN